MADVQLHGVSKRFGDLTAVCDLTLAIGDGEFVVLLGPTGAGKTTTLRLVAGLEKPESGAISIAGHDVTRTPPAGRDVAFVFQQYSLYPHLTVYDNLAFPLRSPLRRTPEAEIKRKVAEVAELLRITPKLGNRATKLSGGEMQRVAIGRALVRQPAVYLMDEPLSSLDAKLRAELRLELKRIQQDLGATILYVTHDQIEAMTMASRIAVINKGVLQQVDTPSMLYDKPDNLFVAGFIGSPAMNFFKAKLVKGDGKLFVDGGSFKVEVPSARIQTYSNYIDRPIIMGIRPEDIHDPHFLPPEIIPQPVDGQVEVTELMGNEIQLHITTGDQTFVARVDPRTRTRMGEHIQVLFNMGNMHLFDSDTEKAIR